MNKIWQIIKTEFKIEFAYPVTWLFFLVIPIIFTLAIGAALGGSSQTTTSSTTDDSDSRPILLIRDEDQTSLSERLIDNLVNSEAINSVVVPMEDEITDEQWSILSGVLTIPVGFENALMENTPLKLALLTASENFTSIAIENEVRSAVGHTSAALMASRSSLVIVSEQTGEAMIEEDAYLEQQLERAQVVLEEAPLYSLVVHELEQEENANTGMMGFNQSSSGQLVTWSLITLLGGSIIFVRDRKDGSFQRMFTTPTRKGIYFIGKVLARMLMGLIQMVILVFFGMYVLHVNWGDDPLLLIAFLSCFSLAGTSFGLMMGAFTKTVKQADNLTTLFSMLMAALGGAWWPLEITPATYQTVVRALPSTWAMLGFNDIIIKGQGLSGVLLEGGVLLGFAALFMTIGIWKLNQME